MSSDIVGPFSNLYSKDVYPQFSSIINLARDLNARIGVPEIVIVGKKGSNKTSFLESFLATPVLPIDKSTPTKRPMFFQFIQNSNCKAPKVTIRRDTKFTEFANDVEVTLEELPLHLDKRNQVSTEPVYINYEYQYLWNMIIVDTPGFISEETDGVTPEQRENLITELCKPSKRLILNVEKAREEGGSENLDFLKSVDPRLDRTIFIFDEVLELLKLLTSGSTTPHVNRFMSSSPRPNTSFWTTVVSGPSRAKYLGDGELFKEKTEQLNESENKLFEQLKYDMKFRTQIGIHSARKFIIGLVWRKYQDSIPQILKKLQGLKQKTSSQVSSIQSKLLNLETYKLRALASQYVMQFLQMIDQLLSGTLAGNPGLNGQTLEEEHGQEEAGPWIDSNYQIIDINAKELGIPHYDSKLYGGQQFGRLMSEFKAVSHNIDFGTVTNNEVATSAGPNNLNNISNISWASSDIAQKRVQRSFLPLIDQLYNRATYIIKRLADIVETILKNKKKQEIKNKNQNSTSQTQMGGWGLSTMGTGLAPSQDSVSAEDYPLFLRTVKSFFYKFVEKTSSECKEKCLDEFYCTRIIYWNQNYYGQKKLPDLSNIDEEGLRDLVEDFAEDIFNTTRERITENVLLKCYNFFLVPMQSDLWGEIQGKVTILTDEQISELFEVESTKKLLQEQKSHLDNILLQFGDQEKNFLEASKKFANANRN